MEKENFIGCKNILIKSGKIIDPVAANEFISDIYIKDGIIKEISKEIKIGSKIDTDISKLKKYNAPFKQYGDLIQIDASKYVVTPGFIDMHVHLRDPGNEEEENIESGIKAALKGGITSVACMPNTNPPLDKEYLIKYIIDKSNILDFKIFPVAAITKELAGMEMTEFGLLKNAGAVAFSDDGFCVMDSRLMYEVMKYAKQMNLPLILHEEDTNFSKFGLINDGFYSSMLGLDGISTLSEELIIARDIILAHKTKAKIHITHVSTKGSLELIRRAKEEGINITCDVTPHHIYFNDSALTDYNTNFKVNPPLRSEEDQQAIVDGIKHGLIDAISSDHAPHLTVEKNTTFMDASYGVIGLETLFKASYTKLCKVEKLNLNKLIQLLTIGPSTILSLNKNQIKTSSIADIAIIDLEQAKKVSENDFISKSKNSPFIGENLFSEVVCTISKGKIDFVK
jgi:dihydroorotase